MFDNYVKTGGDKSNEHKQRDCHGSKTRTEHKNSDACYNCKTVHADYRKSCPAYGKQCQNCMCYGHYATVCRKPKSAHKTHYKPNSSKALQHIAFIYSKLTNNIMMFLSYYSFCISFFHWHDHGHTSVAIFLYLTDVFS